MSSKGSPRNVVVTAHYPPEGEDESLLQPGLQLPLELSTAARRDDRLAELPPLHDADRGHRVDADF
jgi:hypothetical protein